jgi:hypothetical protein
MLQNMYGFEVAGAGVVRPPSGPAQVELHWKGMPGRQYQVQYATNLENPQWTDADNGQISTPGDQVVDLTWSEDLDAGMSGLRVYRIIRNY